MIHYRLNGDIYLGPVRVFNGKRGSPVRWVWVLGALIGVPILIFLIIFWLGFDGLFLG